MFEELLNTIDLQKFVLKHVSIFEPLFYQTMGIFCEITQKSNVGNKRENLPTSTNPYIDL